MKLTNKQADALALRLIADAPPRAGNVTHHETVPGLDDKSWDKLRAAIAEAVVAVHPDPGQTSSEFDNEHGIDSHALAAKAAVPRR